MWISIEILAFCKGHPCGFQLISLHACKEVTQRIPLKSSVAPLCRMQGFQLKPRGPHGDPDGPVPGRLGAHLIGMSWAPSLRGNGAIRIIGVLCILQWLPLWISM